MCRRIWLWFLPAAAYCNDTVTNVYMYALWNCTRYRLHMMGLVTHAAGLADVWMGALKMREWKMQEWKLQVKTTEVEIFSPPCG